jgi:deoxyribose-phosphate aldolase
MIPGDGGPATIPPPHAPPVAANPGTPLDLDAVRRVAVNASAGERRVATLLARRSVKNAQQAAFLAKAITLLDLTTLAGDDTPGRVARLCAKARRPLRAEVQAGLGLADVPLAVAAVCVYPTMVPHAVAALAGSTIPVASVATAFPAGLSPLPLRLAEVRYARSEGAAEIDMVITREHALLGRWQALYDEVRAVKEAGDGALLKVILAVGELGTLRTIARASLVAMMAGADFVKTSTGKEGVNATLLNSLVMLRTIRAYRDATGYAVGFKPAGGLRSAKDALAWMVLVREELGREALEPGLLRLGASSLLSDLERQLSHALTGRYAAWHHQPLP